MPKIPTFKATGSIEQLAGTTSNIQMGLNNTLASALAPVTEAVIDFRVKENTLQNQAEALKLENNFITDMQGVTQILETDPRYATNKEAANKYLKEQSEFFIQKHKALATNGNVQNKFTNYALAETQKSIFKTDKYVSQQIVASLNNEYSKSKKNLIMTAYTDGGLAKQTLPADLTKLTLDTYKSQVSPVELQILIESIPAEIQMYDGLKDVREYPKRTYQFLKDKRYLPDLSFDQREKIKTQAELILRPQLTAEYNNYLKYVADGKTPPKFDWEFAQQVMPVKVAEQMMMNKTVTEGMVDDVKFLSTLPISELDQTVSDLIKTAYDSYPFEVAQKKQKYLIDVVSKQKAELESNPAGFILRTDQEAQDKAEELAAMEADGAAFTAPNQFDRSAIDQTQLEFVELLLDKQEKLGVKNKKVMTSNMSKQFVEEYLEAGKSSDKKKMNNMIDSLVTSYGKNESLALMQLNADGLPFGAEVYGVLKNSELAYMGLSFDTEAEKTEIKEYLTSNDLKFDDIKKEINEGIKPFLNMVLSNTPFDSTESNPQTNKIRNFLTFVASQKLIGNPEMDQSEAVEYAVNKWNDNFVLADTYYVNKQQGDQTFDEEEIARYNDKLNFIKNFYLEEMNIVAFKSNFETDPVKLSAKMYSQMLTNGEWRNAADGEGEVFGIVLDGSFAPVLNEKGEQITSIITDESNFVPGTNIVVDYNKPFENLPEDSVNNLITVYEQAVELARKKGITYEEALKQIEKPIIPNIEFDDGKKNSKILIDEENNQSSILKTIGDAIISPLAAADLSEERKNDKTFVNLSLTKQVTKAKEYILNSNNKKINNENFIPIWSKYYKTYMKYDNKLKKLTLMSAKEIENQEKKAMKRLNNGNYVVKEDAKPSIISAVKVFKGQYGLSDQKLTKIIENIGQIESQYKTKTQYEGGPARSYWQVEPASAISFVKNASPLLKGNFEKEFAGIKRPSGTTVVKYLQSLNEKQMQDILLENGNLAATLSLGMFLNRIK
jgi:hypothetical protein